ncbi:TetR-like C-terminal domain-containing protein [Embleya sp. MST-111070]|uniref:TetR-like C-terminal domain-containing protein n=1 Tax=Embleya sp. MST-111070 TaxID=3398231 RepID=UPI003F737EF7
MRPGGRTARTRAEVLSAVLAELGEPDQGGLTMENVARRSGVHVATIYRRWRTVEGLIVDLLTWISFNEIPFPDTGSLEGDLRALSRSIVALYRDDIRFRTMIETIVAGATRDSAAERALHDFFAERNAGAAVIVERAIARGELPPETDGIELIAALGAPVYYRMLVVRRSLDTALADRAAAAAHAAALAGAFASTDQTGATRR